ncbi:hypothetical protein SRHO_G00235900 [Serrasalmus rhombeus]
MAGRGNACQNKKYPFPTILSEDGQKLQGIEQKTLADILADPVEYQRCVCAQSAEVFSAGPWFHCPILDFVITGSCD